MKRTSMMRAIVAAAIVLAALAALAAVLLARDDGDDGAGPPESGLAASAAGADEAGAPRGRGAVAEPPTLQELQELAAEAERQEMERFSGAKGEGDVPTDGSATTLGEGEAVAVGRGESPERGRSAAQELRWEGWPKKTIPQVGKIYSRASDGSISACSGTVVGRALVLTAAHCLFSQELGRYHTRIVFVPGMTWRSPDDPSSIRAPYGIWQGANWWVPNGYRAGAGDYDWGLLQLAPLRRRSVGAVVGTRPIQANIEWGPGARVQAVGYPASGFWATRKGYHGRGQYACDSDWDGEWERTLNGLVLIVIDCTMNGGASGGPWFVRLNSGNWVIGGVSDFCFGPRMNDPSRYCTPTSYQVKSVALDDDFVVFWNAVLNQLS